MAESKLNPCQEPYSEEMIFPGYPSIKRWLAEQEMQECDEIIEAINELEQAKESNFLQACENGHTANRLREENKKLARRIHNQRVQLRNHWEIMEMRGKMHRPLRSEWWDEVMRLIQRIKELKANES